MTDMFLISQLFRYLQWSIKLLDFFVLASRTFLSNMKQK